MTNLPINERIAVLETKVESIDAKLVILDEIHSELTRYKGFVGGIVFLASAFWTFLLLFKDDIRAKLGI